MASKTVSLESKIAAFCEFSFVTERINYFQGAMKFKLFRYVLTPEDLLNLKNHKYDCRGKGIIEQYVDGVSTFPLFHV